MKLKNYLLLIALIASGYSSIAQVAVPFAPRLPGGNIKVKGDIIFVGNTILGKTTASPAFDGSGNVTNLPLLTTQANTSFTGTGDNNAQNFEYIDVDGDASTFSSSTANLNIVSSCKKIVYAGLYWTATYPYDRTLTSNNYAELNPTSTPRFLDFNQIKFKLPGVPGYVDLTADNGADLPGEEDQIIFDGFNFYPGGNPNIAGTKSFKDSPYVCYKNVTGLLQGLTDANGTYGIANMRASRGARGNGSCGGWTLVIVYESNNLSSKYISVYDGLAGIDSAFLPVDFNIAGFQTLPSPQPVRASVGVVSLEGDLGIINDSFRIKANSVVPFTPLSNGLNPVTNFFNSSITNNNVSIINRNPASTNTLGFDMDIVGVTNPANAVIPNGETGATLRLTTTGDAYSTHIATFAVEIIEPIIVLTKTVQNAGGVDIGGGNVTLGQELNYIIGFQNIGNDNTNAFTIKDILPINIVFNPADLVLPPGVTYTYNAGTRELVFSIPNNLVEIGDPRYEIRLKVFIVTQCNQLSNACSNNIQNQAFATYQGVLNTQQISNDPSLASYSICNTSSPSPTNFLVGIDGCVFTNNAVLCGDTLTLTAANGYNTYTWSTNPSGLPVIGTGQTFVVTSPGTYYSNNGAIAPCLSIQEVYNVTQFGITVVNPVIPFADQVVICGNDGKQLPLIFLCGASDTVNITTNITDALNIVWEKLNEASCAASIANCANENLSCTWSQVGTGPNYLVNAPGQYRMRINYTGGCFNRFYFNVFQNLLAPTFVVKDIICTSPSQITINNVPAGYEYSTSPSGLWQLTNVFNGLPPGSYTIYIRQVGVVNGCVFTVPNISIRTRNFTTSAIVTQPLCNGNLGSVSLAANDVEPQYTYSIFNSSNVLVNTAGPKASNTQAFTNLNAGNYTYTITTQDGCSGNGAFQIINPPVLTATAALTIPLTCSNGQITVYPVGGTAPYAYIVNGNPAVTDPNIEVTTAGPYTIQVVDYNNCVVTVNLTVANNPPPTYTISQTNVLCYGNNTGQIAFNLTNANGCTVEYSVDNGVTFVTNPLISNLIAGTYTIIVRYTLAGSVCLTTAVTRIITEPFSSLTASAGVSELAGCGPGGEGRVRIINPQGGVTPYSYSFDNGATYGAVNNALLAPGTYTVYIKDANGCTYPMTVTIDPAPAAPTITVSPAVFACTGNATSTVTVNSNGGNFNYIYSLDGVVNTPPSNNVFTNVLCGSHTVSVSYAATNIPTFSNLLFEDFGVGPNTTSPGIAAAYCFNSQPYPASSPCGNNVVGFPPSSCASPSYTIEDNQYAVTRAIIPNNCAWFNYRDHTSNGANPNGRFLAVNIGSAAGPYGVLYSKVINNILPNQPILINLYLANLLRAGVGGADPDFILELVDGANNVIASQSTGIIDNVTDGWQSKTLTLNPGANTTLTLKLRSGSILYGGNDAAIDDINVYQIPISCVTVRDFPVTIECNKAFKAEITNVTNVTCAGANNGSITISAENFALPYGFDYSINGGTTWINSATSPVTITGLTNTTYNISIRYDNNAANTACNFPFVQVITAPASLVSSAVVTPATCLVGATITGSATGGTPAYQYQLVDVLNNIIVAYQASPIFTNVPAGSYIVTVRDNNLCTDNTDNPVIVAPANPPTAVIDVTSDFCFDGGNAATLVVTVSGGVAPYLYSINNGANQAGNTFPNLSPGNYIIKVTDAFGCTVTLPSQTINAQLLASAVLTKDLDCTATPNATITATVNGGYPVYTTAVSFNGTPFVASPLVISTANPGTYQFQITDSKGCIALSNIITVNPIVNPSATTTITNVSCNGLLNGSVTFVPASGVAPYTISFNGSPFTATVTYTGLSAGTYPYIIRDKKSCEFAGSVIITQPTTITGVATLTTNYTCSGGGLGNGVITVSGVSGGSGAYTYSIDGLNFVASNVFSGLTNGTYTVTIKDANNCTFITNSVIISPLNPPTDMTFAATALSCPANTSTVTITTIGGNPAFSYQIILPVVGIAQASNVFNNLAPGTYTFQVTDARNCTYQESFTIAPLPVLAVNGTLVGNVRCFGTSTGAASFVVTNSTGFTYTLNGVAQGAGVSPINLTNQPAGIYTIVVTNTNTNCTATASVTISQSAVALSSTLTVTPISCAANGQVVVNAVGGWGGNNYTLTPPVGAAVGPQASNTFTNLSALGTYTVSITDSNACTVTNTFTLTAPVAPTATIAVSSDYCYDPINAATLIVTATGGVAPYQYSINGQPFQNGNTFANLTPGTYTIIVKDSFGCTVTLPVQTINNQLIASAALAKDLDCTASPNAVIAVNVSGGYASYSYQVSVNSSAYSASTPIVGTTFNYSAAAAGTYQFQITDARGCTSITGIITINPISLPIITSVVQGQQILCNGGATASIIVNINAAVGTPAFVINVLNQTTNVNYGTQTSGLPAGNYLITLTDGKSCTDTETITINQPAAILFAAGVVPITCTGSGTTFGQISVTGLTGGVGPYVYTLTSNAAPTQTTPSLGGNYTFTILNYGIYQLSVTDVNGCTLTLPNIIISSPPDDLDINVSTPPATCAAGGTAIITVSAVPPGGPYTFGILTQATAPYAAVFQAADGGCPLQSTFTGLIPGVIYTFVVRDATTGCFYFEQAATAIPPLSNLTSVINVVNNVTCAGNADANVNFTFSNYNATSVTYQIFNAQTNTSVLPAVTLPGLTGVPVIQQGIGPLAPGNYYIRFTENDGINNGCTNASAAFTVTQSVVALSISASIVKNDNCNPLAGQITAIGQGGTAPYTYQILPSGNPAPIATTLGWVASNTLNADSGNYIAYVKDAFGCITQTAVLVLPLDPSPVISLATTTQCSATQGNYSINVTLGTAGIAPYSFSLDGGAFATQTAPITYSNLSSGSHTVQIRDANGCGMTANITIADPIITTPTIAALPTCTNSDGVITLVSTGGSGAYTYTINAPGATIVGNTISNIPPGTYTVTATDGNGCTRDVSVNLPAGTAVTFTTTVNNVSCNGGSNGIITVNLPPTNDNPVYTYQIIAPAAFATAPQNSNVFSGLPANIYTIQVNSGRGCFITDTAIISEPTPVVASATVTAFTCAANNTANVAVITVTGSGGTTAYTYSIDGINYFNTNTFDIVNNGAVQNITVYVKDNNACIDTDIIVVNPLLQITSAPVTQVTAITCTNAEAISITVAGGSGNYTYQLLPAGVVQAGNTFNLPTPGTYYFQVNDVTTGCTFATLPYTVNPFNTIGVVANAVTPVTCFGNADGSININISGYTGPYTYTVFSGALPIISNVPGNTAVNPLVISGLAAGNYTVQVTETGTPFCIFTSNVVAVGSPAAAISLDLISNINANCNANAQVTVNGAGGTPGYTYAFMQNGIPAVFPGDYSASNTASLNPLTNTQWDVYVRDSRGCFTFIAVTIATDALPTVTLPLYAPDQCTSAGSSYTFTANGTGLAPLTYSIGNGFQSSGTFTVSSPGTYIVTVRDVNGCEATASLIIYAPINSTSAITALPTCATNDGVITLSTSGGSGTYTYIIIPNSPGITIAGNTISNVPFGTYTITISDGTICTKDVIVTLIAPTAVIFDTTVTPVTCNLGTDGIITVNLAASNDNPPYTYQITAGPITTGIQNSNVFGNLVAGNYTIVVTSGRACSTTVANIVVGQPAAITVPAPTVTQFVCTPPTNAANLASIVVNGVTGGSGVYTNYQFILAGNVVQFGSNNTYSTSNIAGGTYTINVFDDKGCLGTTTAIINPYISIATPSIIVNTPVTCTSTETITINVITSGGIAPAYNYTVDGIGTNPYLVTQASPTFTGLTIGDYLVTVTNPITGCSVQTIHFVFDPNTFNLTINNVVAITCLGESNGAASITIIDNNLVPTNDAGAFSYTIVNSANVTVAFGNNVNAGPLNIIGLAAGIYTANVTLTNNPFCSVSQNFTIGQPASALSVSATSTPITCVPTNNGTIQASANGGWGGPYQFELMLGAVQIAPYSTNPNFAGLSAGNYTVNVRDIRGCINDTNVVLVNPTPISATVTGLPATLACFGASNATITVTNVIGGQGSNYTYTLNTAVPVSSSGPSTNPVFTGLAAGTYSVTIRDAFGCEFTSANIIIAQPAMVTADLVLSTAQTCLNQSVLTLTAAGGTAPYSYSIDGITYVAGTFNPSITISVPVGTYSYIIKDANGCTSVRSNDITITPLGPLNLNLISVDTVVECFGDGNGFIIVNATGGLGNYQYTLTGINYLGAAVSVGPQPSGAFNGLLASNAAGYSVTVTSNDCTTPAKVVTITQPTATLSATPIITNVKCFGQSTGAVTITPAGGTAPYRYAISPNLNQFDTLNTFANLSIGNYTILVQDANGCFISVPVVITQPNALVAGITAVLDETCAGENDGTFTISNIAGGTAPYTVSYSVGNINSTPITLPNGTTDYVYDNLPGNVAPYIITIRDANGCDIIFDQLILKGASFTAFPDTNYDCVNNVSVNSTTIIVKSDPAGQVAIFSLDGGPDTLNNVFTGLTPGLHTVNVQIDGCAKDVTFTIDAVTPLTLAINPVSGLNQILVTAGGGSGNYVNYEFSLGGTVLQSGNSNAYITTQTGTYTIVVTDSNGCTATIDIYKVFIPIKIPDFFTPGGDGINEGWGPTNTENYKNIETKIFDRYGREIASLRVGELWYGKYNGNELPSGDYWYVIRIDGKNDTQYVGHFTLYR